MSWSIIPVKSPLIVCSVKLWAEGLIYEGFTKLEMLKLRDTQDGRQGGVKYMLSIDGEDLSKVH